MKIRHSVLALLACVLTLAVVSTAMAQERNYWRHSRGHFENTTGNKWTEKIDKEVYHFVETERTAKRVEIYDKSRDVTVHLYEAACWVKLSGKKWEKYYDGRWGK
jgi:hypothetical protein